MEPTGLDNINIYTYLNIYNIYVSKYINKEIDFKKLVNVTMEADKSNICRVAGWLKHQERADVLFKSKGCLLQNSLLLGGGHSFVLFRPSTDWMRPTHVMGCNRLYSRSTNLMYISSKNILTETFRVTLDHISGYSGPAKLTHKTKHCKV